MAKEEKKKEQQNAAGSVTARLTEEKRTLSEVQQEELDERLFRESLSRQLWEKCRQKKTTLQGEWL